MRYLFKPWMLLAIGIAPCMGCDQGPSYPCANLQGEVTIGSKPLDDGGIQFLPITHGTGPTVGSDIKAGKYAVQGVPLGKVRVLFTAVRKTHKLPPSSDGIEKWATENLIPEAHRKGVEIEVAADETSRDFALTTE